MILIVILLYLSIGLLISIVVKLDRLISLLKKIADSKIVVKAVPNPVYGKVDADAVREAIREADENESWGGS